MDPCEIFTSLKEKKLVKHVEKKDEFFGKVEYRHLQNQIILNQKFDILSSTEKLSKYLKAIKEFGIGELDFGFDFSQHLTSTFFSEIESFKTFLLEILEKEKLGFSNSTMLGTIVSRLADELSLEHDELRAVLEVEFRNSYGHDDYYFDKDNIFIKKSNDEIIPIHVKDLLGRFKKFNHFSGEFRKKYLKEYNRKLFDEIEKFEKAQSTNSSKAI